MKNNSSELTIRECFSEIPEWERLKQRYLDYWNSKRTIIAHVQNPNPVMPVKEDWMFEASEEKYLDPSKLYTMKKCRRAAWNWHGDLFKYFSPSYGSNMFAGFCGGKVVFGADTVWCEPVISALDESDKIHFTPDNRFWRAHLEAVEYFTEQSNGIELLAMTDFGGATDWIASLMGTEHFLMESILNPDKMREFALRLASECCEPLNIILSRFARIPAGYVNWMPFWSDRPMNTVQDDMAINFSPEMYAEIFLPALKLIARQTDITILHWHDGSSQHIDSLLKCAEIDMIQYGHDPSSGDFKNYLDNMLKIQDSGKKLFISCVDSGDVDFFLENLDHSSLAMIVNTKNNKESGQVCRKMCQITQEKS